MCDHSFYILLFHAQAVVHPATDEFARISEPVLFVFDSFYLPLLPVIPSMKYPFTTLFSL